MRICFTRDTHSAWLPPTVKSKASSNNWIVIQTQKNPKPSFQSARGMARKPTHCHKRRMAERLEEPHKIADLIPSRPLARLCTICSHLMPLTSGLGSLNSWVPAHWESCQHFLYYQNLSLVPPSSNFSLFNPHQTGYIFTDSSLPHREKTARELDQGGGLHMPFPRGPHICFCFQAVPFL